MFPAKRAGLSYETAAALARPMTPLGLAPSRCILTPSYVGGGPAN